MQWGIIGTGGIARKFAQTLSQMGKEGETLVAVASRQEASAQAFAREHGAARAYGSYEAMMQDPQVEVVYIATPNALHFDNVRMCLQAGKHVLCEKPFTLNAAQARALYALAAEQKRFVMEAFWIRFLPVLLEMRAVIARGEIGTPVHVRSDYGFIPAPGRSERKFTAELGGGALLDIGIYNLGFAHMVFDAPPQRIQSSVHKNAWGTDDFSTVLLEYPGQGTASLTTSIGLDMPREAAVFGTEGEIQLDDFQMAQRLTVRQYAGATREIAIPFDVNGFEYQIREVRRCVAQGLTTSDVLRPQDTLAVLDTMDSIRASWGMRFPGEA